MNTNVNKKAEARIEKPGCFVAGTLVHTQTGLKPIEQIQVGEYVLSKPESVVGEASYKRVIRTFEYQNREVWYVRYAVLDSDYEQTEEGGFLVVTGGHLFWVRGCWESGEYRELSIWQQAKEFADQYLSRGMLAIFELQDGRLASCEDSGPIIWTSEYEDVGIVYTELTIASGNDGLAISFKNGHPERLRNSSNKLQYLFADDEWRVEFEHLPDDAVAVITYGFPPLLRTVYNLEVEENHTYYVGELKVLVHDTNERTG